MLPGRRFPLNGLETNLTVTISVQGLSGVEEIQGDIYDYPKYYDLVYGSDWKAEFDFLLACADRFLDQPLKSAFEPACGTGRLLYRLGKAGFQVAGNDLNPKAVEFCNQRLARFGLSETAAVADMADFHLTEPVDLGFNMINSFRHLNTEALAAGHLQCMARAIRSGGIYVLGLHLVPLRGEACENEAWSATRGHLTVNSDLWLIERKLEERYEEYAMHYDIYTPSRQFRIRDQLRFRTYTADQFCQLVDRTEGLKMEAVFDFQYDLSEPVTLDESTEDAIFILRAG